MQLGPGVPGRRSLGAESFDDFMGRGSLEGEDRAELVEEHGSFSVVRYPLPGTPGDDGRLTGPPRGAGTGWVRLARYRGGGLLDSLRVRFTEPRSVSFAARDWNLICHLRSFGVGTPEPLCVGSAKGGGFSRDSFLVTRELSREVPLGEWLVRVHDPRARSSGLEALGATFARLFGSRVELPGLTARSIFVGVQREEQECDDHGPPGTASEMRRRRLPAVVLTEVRGGRIGNESTLEARAELLARLFREVQDRMSVRDASRVFRTALGSASREERARVWKRIAR